MNSIKNVAFALLMGATIATGCKSLDEVSPTDKSLDEVVMEVDTTYSPMSDFQKDVAAEGYETAKGFLKDKGVNLRATRGADLKVGFSNVGDFVDRYLGGENRSSPNRISDKRETIFEDSREEVFFYLDLLNLEDTLTVRGEEFIEKKEKWDASVKVTMTGGIYFSKDRYISVNVPAKIYSARLISDKIEGIELSPSKLVSKVFVHELGHSVGLVHPSAFVNLEDSLYRDNVMGGELSENYELSTLQMILWKEGLTPGTRLNRAVIEESREQDPAPLVEFYEDLFSRIPVEAYVKDTNN